MLKVAKRKDRNTYVVKLEKIGGGRKFFKTYEEARN